MVSNQSGKSNILNKLKKYKILVKKNDYEIEDFLNLTKKQEMLWFRL